MSTTSIAVKYRNIGVVSVTALVGSVMMGTGKAAAAYNCDLKPADTGYSSAQAGLCNSVSEGNQVDIFTGDDPLFQKVVNILLFLVGAISVIMLIIGGIRYIVSAGDQNAVTGAKNTIMYAIVGVIVAVVAYGVVNFLLTRLYE